MKEKLQLYPHILPDLEDWPIHRLSLKRREFIREINAFTLARLQEKYNGDFEELLAKTVYQERIRIRSKPWRVDRPDEKQFWTRIHKDLVETSEIEIPKELESSQLELLEKIIARYSDEIVGSFVPKTYLQARKILTFFFKRLLNKYARTARGWGKKEQLFHRIKIYGPIEMIRELARKGTIVLVPTHFSNLDSLLIGYAIDAKVGLPSFSYGAGLNLYNFGPAAYFMNRLGAYRVDRRKKNPVYLETLKSMSNLSIQQGIHSLFFPGGTRSRSGMTEKKLKLGLLGTAIEAQRAICQKKLNNKVFIVPLILDYHFVLEARFLIEEYLQSMGKERYLSIRDFSKSKRKLLKFLFQYYNRSSEIVMSFGQPFDVFGNFVREDGSSVDEHNRLIEVADYFTLDGEVTQNLQRENVYTKLLSDRIVERFYKDNVVLTSHLVAFTAFQILLKDHPELDLFGILKLPFEDFEVSMPRFRSQVIIVLRQLKKMEAAGNIRLSEPLSWDLDEMIRDGVDKLGLYHDKKPLKITETNFVTSENFKLLFYYHNRLENYGLDKLIRSRPRLATTTS